MVPASSSGSKSKQTRTDLLNSLLALLLRLQEHTVAILADIESMFMQIAVKQDQSALCFLWSKNTFIIFDFWA